MSQLAIVALLALALAVRVDALFSFVNVAPWSKRYGAFSGVLNGGIVIGGGFNGNSRLSDVWSSLDGGVTWGNTGASGLAPIAFAAAAVFQANATTAPFLVVAGGDTSAVVYQTFDAQKFVIVTSNFPGALRLLPALVPVSAGVGSGRQSLYFLGGSSNSKPFTNFNDVYTSSDGASWSLVTASAPWLGRTAFGVAAVDDRSRVVIVGGDNFFGAGLLSDAWISNVGLSKWTKLTTSGLGPLQYGRAHALLLNVDNVLYLVGGETNASGMIAANNDIWQSTDDGDTFSSLIANDKFPGLSEQSLVQIGRRVVMFGGGDRQESVPRNDVYSGFLPISS